MPWRRIKVRNGKPEYRIRQKECVEEMGLLFVFLLFLTAISLLLQTESVLIQKKLTMSLNE